MSAWNYNAERRREQIRDGLDLSYCHVLAPAILESLPSPNGTTWADILDAGCGPGVLAHMLSEKGWNVTGVDESATMIEVARGDYADKQQLSFVQAKYAQLDDLFGRRRFDVVVANMSLTGVPDLFPVLKTFRSLLRRRGKVILTDVHPWFWRLYKGHHDLSYWETRTLVEPFTISLDRRALPAATSVTYRRLEEICGYIAGAGFLIERITEPRPPQAIEEQYPDPWTYPRFIAIVARRR